MRRYDDAVKTAAPIPVTISLRFITTLFAECFARRAPELLPFHPVSRRQSAIEP
jgi:hypothetical protein